MMALAIFAGCLAGAFNGLISAAVVRLAIGHSNLLFFTVWGAAMFYRLVSTLGLFALAFMKGWPHPLAMVLSMLAVQMASQLLMSSREADHA